MYALLVGVSLRGVWVDTHVGSLAGGVERGDVAHADFAVVDFNDSRHQLRSLLKECVWLQRLQQFGVSVDGQGRVELGLQK